MPGKVKVRILSGRHLPVMDRSSDTTDAFAEVKLGDTTYKTDVYRKSLNPNWNSEWFRFDVDGNHYIENSTFVRNMIRFRNRLTWVFQYWSSNPNWNVISDRDLQDEPLQVRIMDYDTYSANDAIGKGMEIYFQIIAFVWLVSLSTIF